MMRACWNCAAMHDDMTDMPHKPCDGDAMMCFCCGEWNTYDSYDLLGMRRPTAVEYVKIGNDPTCRSLRSNWEQCDGSRQASPIR